MVEGEVMGQGEVKLAAGTVVIVVIGMLQDMVVVREEVVPMLQPKVAAEAFCTPEPLDRMDL